MGKALSEPHHKKTPHHWCVVGRVEGLPETHENSNFILLRIPIEISVLDHGELRMVMDPDRLRAELGINEKGIADLRGDGLILPSVRQQVPRPKIDYRTLQETYRRMLDDGPFTTQTDLARHLGVSRVWVSRVLKGLWKRAG